MIDKPAQIVYTGISKFTMGVSMIGLTPEKIAKRFCAERELEDGWRIVNRDGITSLLVQENMVAADIAGRQRVHVTIRLDDAGQVAQTQCSVCTGGMYAANCRHVAALMLEMTKQQHQQKLMQITAHAGADAFVQYADLAIYENSAIRIETTIELAENSPVAKVSFRMGETKLYSVRSLYALLHAVENKEPLRFGKHFTFYPQSQRLTPEVCFVLDFIADAVLFAHQAGGEACTGKYLHVPTSLTERLLDGLVGDCILSKNGVPLSHGRISEEKLPLAVYLSQLNNTITMHIRAADEIKPVTKSGKYLVCGTDLYRLSKGTAEILQPVVDRLCEMQNPYVQFDFERAQQLFEVYLPKLEQVLTVQYDSTLKENIVHIPVEPKVYFDRMQTGIHAQVSFVYGETTVNPFMPGKQNWQGKFVQRNIEKEDAILSLLSHYGFFVRTGECCLWEEEALFRFLTEGLPQLQQLCSVYYSESFRQIRVKERYSVASNFYMRDNGLVEFSFSIEDVPPEEVQNLLGALRVRKKYYLLKTGELILLQTDALQSLDAALQDIPDFQLANGSVFLPLQQAILTKSLLEESTQVSISEGFNNLLQQIAQPELSAIQCPSPLQNVLRNYQLMGFRWLNALAACNLGGILADDMGLGKTVQVLSLIAHTKLNGQTLPTLVVAPTSLLYNWLEEIKKFTPDLSACVVSGAQTQRAELIAHLHEYDIVITSYPLIRRDFALYTQAFQFLILDEAQYIKNPGSLSARAVKTLQAQARFALTGTPVENSINDLWSIFDYILPGYLGTFTKFVKQMEAPILRDGDTAAKELLLKKIRPFLLRRVKQDVLKELPAKNEYNLYAEMTLTQRLVYKQYLDLILKQTQDFMQEGFAKNRIQILAGITRLRQICCHPSTFLDHYEGGSGKIDLLMEVIDQARSGGHRMLVFSQFTTMLGLIRERLTEEGIPYQYIDGDINAVWRAERIRAFNSGAGDVFLISLRAGGTGLNLTAADVVVHFDPWWNPAVEDQATDRAHRIGQMQTVSVIHLITRGSIEERIIALQEKKRELLKTIILPGEGVMSLGEDDIRYLMEALHE